MAARHGRPSWPRAEGSVRAMMPGVVIGVLGLLAAWAMFTSSGQERADGAGTKPLGEAPGITDADRTLPTEPFEMAVPDLNGSTTLLFPDESSSGTTSSTTTTLLPGQDSDDQVCRAMSNLYDASRSITDPNLDPAVAIGIYRERIDDLAGAVSTSPSTTIAAQRGALLQLQSSVVTALANDPTYDTLRAQYQLMTDTGNPAVVALLQHLRGACPEVATTVEVGLR